MNQPRTTRRRVPSPVSLGLTRQSAAEDLTRLGWDDEDHRAVLSVLSSTGDPDRALNAVVRLVETLDEQADAQHPSAELLSKIDTDPDFRVRLLALLGGSTLLGDHVVANPDIWPELAGDLPEREEIMAALTDSVGAEPVEGHEGDSLLFRATVTGVDADRAMRTAYRTVLARIAAIDLADTFSGTATGREFGPERKNTAK
ncbi:MAG: bifunctional glutamine-synthetase adenylyltransferase/deadenyltransferase, partial [Corynebacterium sp.]|nr:bifunctional glutamine-synthetase adenylyltransferase/deadenyltransferase [Corynebacterium sp.]